jgi:hypothetical protein
LFLLQVRAAEPFSTIVARRRFGRYWGGAGIGVLGRKQRE